MIKDWTAEFDQFDEVRDVFNRNFYNSSKSIALRFQMMKMRRSAVNACVNGMSRRLRLQNLKPNHLTFSIIQINGVGIKESSMSVLYKEWCQVHILRVLKRSGVNFTIILRPAFMPTDPKSAKRQSNQAAFCTFGILGCIRKRCA